MPNWVTCNLTVSGNATDIAKFRKKAASIRVKVERKIPAFTFEAFIPMPKELVGTVALNKPNPELLKKYGYSDWYNRNLGELGTKWDVHGYLDFAMPDKLGYTFDSAWSPPARGVAKLALVYPKLKFVLVYDEPDDNFAGELTFEGGKLVRKVETESISAKEYSEDA